MTRLRHLIVVALIAIVPSFPTLARNIGLRFSSMQKGGAQKQMSCSTQLLLPLWMDVSPLRQG